MAGSDAGAGADGSVSQPDAGVDAPVCPSGQARASCANPIAALAGCGAVELCGSDGTGNGLDDNCDGHIDETCACTPGQSRQCFVGPPAKRGIGACTDGVQTCAGTTTGTWGPCVGSIGPSSELCDDVDNDCDGCKDDGLCCGGGLECPTPGDPRIADQAPYTDVTFEGNKFFSGSAMSWSWTVTGLSPCDQLFSTSTGNPPVQSFTVTNANTSTVKTHFMLSGDYAVKMTAVGTDGVTNSCSWVQHVTGPGIRFELCWDHTGLKAQGGADLDLHVHRPGTTTAWFETSAKTNTDDVFYADSTPDAYVGCAGTCSVPSWGYTASAITSCAGAPVSDGGHTWTATTDNCPNPRLDEDNVDTVGKPENTNIDNPKNGDKFRAMVHYFGQDGGSSTTTVEEHPIVNVYCGGFLKASYGAAPNQLSGFNRGTGFALGQMWRVADVVAVVDANGATTDCVVSAIHAPATTSGYDITNSDTTY